MKCKDCQFFHGRAATKYGQSTDGRGACRRYAPRPGYNSDAVMWPTVEGHLPACGDMMLPCTVVNEINFNSTSTSRTPSDTIQFDEGLDD